jgi:hypothetical protein
MLLRPSARILVPSLVVSASIGALAAERLTRRKALAVIVLTAAAVQAAFVTLAWSGLQPWRIVTQSADEYLRPNINYREIKWAQQFLPQTSRTLVVGAPMLFWFDTPSRGGGNFDGPRVSALLESSQLATRLKADGITHVAFFAQGLTRRAGPYRERFTALSSRAQHNVLQLLRTDADRVAASPRVAVYRLRYR